MLLKIVQVGEPVLRQKAEKLSFKQLKSTDTQHLIDLMIATLRDRPGVGLAAPQVGESLQVIVVEDLKEYHGKVSKELLDAQGRKPISLTVIINPILQVDEREKNNFYFEGCLSVEGYVAIVPRANKVSVTGLDRNGEPITFTAEGWFARILQHEMDHLSGVLYIDTMLPRTYITEKYYAATFMKAQPAKIASYVEQSRKH